MPGAARGAVAFALLWAGAVALFGIVLVMSVRPFVGALGCPGGCPDDPVLMRVLRLALGIAVAFCVLAAVVLGLLAAARRTPLAGPALGVVAGALLLPTGLAVAEMVRGESGAAWPAVVFLGLGVPGLALGFAAWAIWRPPRR